MLENSKKLDRCGPCAYKPSGLTWGLSPDSFICPTQSPFLSLSPQSNCPVVSEPFFSLSLHRFTLSHSSDPRSSAFPASVTIPKLKEVHFTFLISLLLVHKAFLLSRSITATCSSLPSLPFSPTIPFAMPPIIPGPPPLAPAGPTKQDLILS